MSNHSQLRLPCTGMGIAVHTQVNTLYLNLLRENSIYISDQNECATESLCGENGVCVNGEGSYKCSCVEGYIQAGSICTGIYVL